jgi:hypothetical protein
MNPAVNKKPPSVSKGGFNHTKVPLLGFPLLFLIIYQMLAQLVHPIKFYHATFIISFRI